MVSIFGMCATSQITTLQNTLKQQSRKDSTKQTREDSTCLPQVLCEIAYCCVVLVKNNLTLVFVSQTMFYNVILILEVYSEIYMVVV